MSFDRTIIEAHIQDAKQLRAAYLAAAVSDMVQWLKAVYAEATKPVQAQLTRPNLGGLGHTFKNEVLP